MKKEEKRKVIIFAGMLYASSRMSIRDLVNAMHIPKTTLHKYISKDLQMVDPPLYRVVRRKLDMYQKQIYNFKLTATETRVLNAKTRNNVTYGVYTLADLLTCIR